jgi:two-component sensor histidine kinase
MSSSPGWRESRGNRRRRNFAPEQSKSLGMKLVQGFVQSLDDELIIDSSQAGSRFTVLMPPPTLM